MTVTLTLPRPARPDEYRNMGDRLACPGLTRAAPLILSQFTKGPALGWASSPRLACDRDDGHRRDLYR